MPDPIYDAATEIEDWLASRLEKLPDLFAISGDRVFPNHIPALEALPCVVYRRSGTVRDSHMTSPSGLVKARFSVECLAAPDTQGYKTTLRMARAIRLGCDGYKGSDREKGFYVRNMVVEDEADDPDATVPMDGNLQIIQRRTLVVLIAFMEPKRTLSGGA